MSGGGDEGSHAIGLVLIVGIICLAVGIAVTDFGLFG